MKAKLTIKGGQLVTFIDMPPFDPLPKGIYWNSRVFFLINDSLEWDDVNTPVYEEDILWYFKPWITRKKEEDGDYDDGA